MIFSLLMTVLKGLPYSLRPVSGLGIIYYEVCFSVDCHLIYSLRGETPRDRGALKREGLQCLMRAKKSKDETHLTRRLIIKG